MSNDVAGFRSNALSTLTDACGVYALCDLDERPIYVGQSFSEGTGHAGIRPRVRRHLTSARSDVIANRVLDVWEIGFVWAWPCTSRARTDELEAHLYHLYEGETRLLNGHPLPQAASPPVLPPKQRVQVLPDNELARRREMRFRLPRQLQQVVSLMDYILEVKDEPHLRRAMAVHFDRLARYHSEFQSHS